MGQNRSFFRGKTALITGGLLTGIISVMLVILGNPKNMGFCIACFIRDMAGALKLHSAAPVQYLRPEILGLVLGAFIISSLTGEFKPRGGSSPMLRFCISFMVMIGALAFLGCPFRMILRLSAGDLNALVGLLGFVSGIGTGCLFLSKGFNLGRNYEQNKLNGLSLPVVNVALLLLVLLVPTLFVSSESGPGSMHSALSLSLSAGILVGCISQRTRFCMAGGIRDLILIKDSTLISGFVAIFISALIMNLVTGDFRIGFTDQPVAHTAWLWNFLGMYVVGLGSSLLGGCPLRQLIMAGEGNSDSAISVLGMFTGAAFSHNFGLAGVAGTDYGLSTNGKVAVISCVVLLLLTGSIITFSKYGKNK